MSEDRIKDEMEVENDDGEVNEVCVCDIVIVHAEYDAHLLHP